jgi:Protein of unknown function (DUF3224)
MGPGGLYMLAGKRIAAVCFITAFGLAAFASKLPANASTGIHTVTEHAKGTFEVKVLPQTDDVDIGDPTIGRFALDKQFHGDLDGNSKGQMLGSRSDNSTGGYVAIERFSGSLSGHKGSFSLQHIGTMQGGKSTLDIQVIPGSGSDELEGIAGHMTIVVADGKHSYDFSYTLPR